MTKTKKPSKTAKLLTAMSRGSLTNQQIQTRCGFVSATSVTAAIAHLKRDGVRIVTTKSREGLNRYTLA